MNHEGRAWISRLPDELGGQRSILDRLLSLCEATEGVRWLVVGCSVGRGVGDGLSDLDVAVGVREEGFPAIAADVRRGEGRQWRRPQWRIGWRGEVVHGMPADRDELK